MSVRLTTVLLFLLLAGCATSGSGTPEIAQSEPSPPAAPPPPQSSAPTIDEHLYIPQPEPIPAREESDHVHPGVWERLTHSFELPECLDREANVKWAQWYAERPDYMARVFKRAQPWIYHIATELERRDMPGELALLPIVESAYDPFAYSSGRALGVGRDEGVTKLLFDPESKRILGAGIVGVSAGELIGEAVLALEMGADVEDLGLTIHPHPTLSESIAMAAEAFEGTLTELYLPKRG